MGIIHDIVDLYISIQQNKKVYIDGLMQESCNSIANAQELCLSCINPSIDSFWGRT